jgi:hypothetical protein
LRLKTLKNHRHVIPDLLEIEKVEKKIDSVLALESPSVTEDLRSPGDFGRNFTLNKS